MEKAFEETIVSPCKNGVQTREVVGRAERHLERNGGQSAKMFGLGAVNKLMFRVDKVSPGRVASVLIKRAKIHPRRNPSLPERSREVQSKVRRPGKGQHRVGVQFQSISQRAVASQ